WTGQFLERRRRTPRTVSHRTTQGSIGRSESQRGGFHVRSHSICASFNEVQSDQLEASTTAKPGVSFIKTNEGLKLHSRFDALNGISCYFARTCWPPPIRLPESDQVDQDSFRALTGSPGGLTGRRVCPS